MASDRKAKARLSPVEFLDKSQKPLRRKSAKYTVFFFAVLALWRFRARTCTDSTFCTVLTMRRTLWR